MKRVLVAVAIGLFLAAYCTVFAGEPEWKDIGRENVDVSALLLPEGSTKLIYMAKENSVLETTDGGQEWRVVFSIPGRDVKINRLANNKDRQACIYAATSSGLFASFDRGKRWQRIFKGKNDQENNCWTVLAFGDYVYLGTQSGLFVSRDSGRTFVKERQGLPAGQISNIAYNPQGQGIIYVSGINGVFKSDLGQGGWEKCFSWFGAKHTEEDLDGQFFETDEQGQESRVSCVVINPVNPGIIYLAGPQGIFKSIDAGKVWEEVSLYGMFNRNVRYLLVEDQNSLFAVSDSAIFEHIEDRWYERSMRLIAKDIRQLAIDKENNIYAACDSGLFKAKASNLPDKILTLVDYFQDEPDIQKVQKAAIDYAEVGMDKIKNWRRLAARKAWLPDVSVGLNRDLTDLWHWETGSTIKTDDDYLRRGKDAVDWDIGLSWDLGDLIWSDAQTSIDVRSRLLVELRDDVLGEVTKLYYERIRIKMELEGLSLDERKKRFDKELRLREITALLDGFTDGYFSRQLNNKQDNG
ncbi:MAG: hypothetical protein ABIG46_08390 [Candidatus Omnitrophota bacterium]|nr:hypothetical protein [Candidatus Omnitrophota bacterium]